MLRRRWTDKQTHNVRTNPQSSYYNMMNHELEFRTKFDEHQLKAFSLPYLKSPIRLTAHTLTHTNIHAQTETLTYGRQVDTHSCQSPTA